MPPSDILVSDDNSHEDESRGRARYRQKQKPTALWKWKNKPDSVSKTSSAAQIRQYEGQYRDEQKRDKKIPSTAFSQMHLTNRVTFMLLGLCGGLLSAIYLYFFSTLTIGFSNSGPILDLYLENSIVWNITATADYIPSFANRSQALAELEHVQTAADTAKSLARQFESEFLHKWYLQIRQSLRSGTCDKSLALLANTIKSHSLWLNSLIDLEEICTQSLDSDLLQGRQLSMTSSSVLYTYSTELFHATTPSLPPEEIIGQLRRLDKWKKEQTTYKDTVAIACNSFQTAHNIGTEFAATLDAIYRELVRLKAETTSPDHPNGLQNRCTGLDGLVLTEKLLRAMAQLRDRNNQTHQLKGYAVEISSSK